MVAAQLPPGQRFYSCLGLEQHDDTNRSNPAPVRLPRYLILPLITSLRALATGRTAGVAVCRPWACRRELLTARPWRNVGDWRPGCPGLWEALSPVLADASFLGEGASRWVVSALSAAGRTLAGAGVPEMPGDRLRRILAELGAGGDGLSAARLCACWNCSSCRPRKALVLTRSASASLSNTRTCEPEPDPAAGRRSPQPPSRLASSRRSRCRCGCGCHTGR